MNVEIMDAITYTSNTETTKEYAFLLGKHTGLPVSSLQNAKGAIADGAKITYLAWGYGFPTSN